MQRLELNMVAVALVAVGVALGAPAAARLTRLGCRLLGLDDMAAWWERRLGWCTPVARALAASCTFVVALVLLYRAWN